MQPCFVFVGDGFDSKSELKMAKSLLLDFFRGRQIDAINLKVDPALGIISIQKSLTCKVVPLGKQAAEPPNPSPPFPHTAQKARSSRGLLPMMVGRHRTYM